MKEKQNNKSGIPFLSPVVKGIAYIVVWLVVAVFGFGKGLLQMAWEGINKKSADDSSSLIPAAGLLNVADAQSPTTSDQFPRKNIDVTGKISLVINRIDLANGEKLEFKYYELPLEVFTIVQKLPGVGFKGRAALDGVRLDDFTKEDAHKYGIDFTMESVVRFTLAKRKVNQLVRSVGFKTNHTPDETSQEESKPVETAVTPEIHESTTKVFKQAEGTVISAGKATVKLPKRPSFEVFEVVLQKEGGERVHFNGERLKAIFMESKFGIGDLVCVTQFAKETISSTGNDGKSNTYSVNPFTVKVIQQAHA